MSPNVHFTKTVVLAGVSCMGFQAGCAAGVEPEEFDSLESVDDRDISDELVEERGTRIDNGLAFSNGLSFSNGLALSNGLSLSNGLAYSNGLAVSNGLAYSNGLAVSNGFLTNAPGRKLVRYIVECALPAGDQIIKGNYTFHGKVGLAPEWKTGHCDEDCQEWVSACLLARTNATGSTVSIDMRASHPAIGTGSGNSRFTEQEAAFFGNLFANPPVAYSCMGDQWENGLYLKRSCANTSGACAIKSADYLNCFYKCDASSNGVFVDCPDTMHDQWRAATHYPAITTYLPVWWTTL
ncbi:MAG: hypothetical protein V3V08_01520 [Nannocystaceae bacterium]